MTKLQKIVFIVFILLIGTLIYIESVKPSPINWFASYSKEDKIPLGTYVFHDLMLHKFKERLKEKNRPAYEILSDTTVKGTYLFINNFINFDTTELEQLLKWTEKGNTLFISSNSHVTPLLDTLNLSTKNDILLSSYKQEPLFNLTNKRLSREQPYYIKRDFNIQYFHKIDTVSQTVLGITQAYKDTLFITEPKINFIKAPYGKGIIYLHNQPEVFSNYFLLEQPENINYTKGVLSYLPTENSILWDNYYKSGKPTQISPLRIIFNNPSLKWAYYLMLIGVIIFVFFEGKRKQRSIPVILPLTNKTYDYTRTISGMYLDARAYHEIAQKQINLFMEWIRTRLRVPSESIDARFLKSIAEKSNNSYQDTKKLFTFIKKVQQQNNTSSEELLLLNNYITSYKNKIDGTA